MMIRVSLGVGSSPKMWAVATGPGATRGGTQVGEFDLSPDAGWYGYVEDDGNKVVEPEESATGINGMSGMVWPADGGMPTDRKLYRSVDEWVADVAAEYPDAEIVRADSKPQSWL